jgi:Acetyltransferases, including N-acetylases of ribosomal proteins
MDIYQSKQLRLMIDLVEEKVTIGTIDLYDIDAHNRRAGIGILIDDDYRRRGFAKQALELMSNYAFDFLYLHQIYAYIAQSNTNSISLFEKAGYQSVGILKDWLQRGEEFEDVYLSQLLNDK